MINTKPFAGVLSPVLTPYKEDLSPDAKRFVMHCRWLLEQGVNGLAVFGTTSEANSLSVGERIALFDALIAGGIRPELLMPGTGCCSLMDTVQLTTHAVRNGCAGVLMLPPFYYKPLNDDGIFANVAEVIERVGDDRLRIYLYHIPPIAQVPITLALIDRLLEAYPGTVAGVKDSSGDWDNTRAMLEQFQPQGFDVFPGSETFLLAALRGGGAGCISATANVNPGPIARLAKTWEQADADEQQAALDAVRQVFQSYVMIPALKAAIAHYSNDAEWVRLRPPLVELDDAQQTALGNALDGIGFSMPGLRD